MLLHLKQTHLQQARLALTQSDSRCFAALASQPMNGSILGGKFDERRKNTSGQGRRERGLSVARSAMATADSTDFELQNAEAPACAEGAHCKIFDFNAQSN